MFCLSQVSEPPRLRRLLTRRRNLPCGTKRRVSAESNKKLLVEVPFPVCGRHLDCGNGHAGCTGDLIKARPVVAEDFLYDSCLSHPGCTKQQEARHSVAARMGQQLLKPSVIDLRRSVSVHRLLKETFGCSHVPLCLEQESFLRKPRRVPLHSFVEAAKSERYRARTGALRSRSCASMALVYRCSGITTPVCVVVSTAAITMA